MEYLTKRVPKQESRTSQKSAGENDSPFHLGIGERVMGASHRRETGSSPPYFQGKGLTVQASLKIGAPGDRFEQEADTMADQVMRMFGPGENAVQRKCPNCEEEKKVQRKEKHADHVQPGPEALIQPSADFQATLGSSKGGGTALDPAVRRFMEPRFGNDFGDVLVHSGDKAVQMSQDIHAQAFTYGNHIYFNSGKYQPETSAGKRLLAHELTHVVQQQAAPPIRRQAEDGSALAESEQEQLSTPAYGQILQRVPGDGMSPPGDCSWVTYLSLRGAVEAAKAGVSSLGACRAGDSCTMLAIKIGAIAAEIAARIALDYTCFRGGDTGHRQQIQDKVNMMNRCYQHFTSSNCPQEIFEAVKEVVEAIAKGVLTIVAVVALIALIILLAEAIAAAAAGAAVAAAAAAVIAVLVWIQGEIAPADDNGA